MKSLRQLALVCSMAAVTTSWHQISLAQSTLPLLERMTPVSDAMLANPPAGDWLNWRRTYDTYGFSPLDQINRSNVSQLREAYRIPLQPGSNTPTPLVHDGVMFLLATDDTLLAMDASSGETLWTFKHPTHPDAQPSAKVGIALHGDKIIMPTNDMHVLAINAKTGALIWDQALDNVRIGRRAHQLHATPLIANGMVIQGVTATMVPEGGFMVGLDLETGEEVWRFHAIPRPGEAGDETWNGLELSARSGGSVWMPPSYDAELDLVYFGTAPTYDTASLLNKSDLPGVNNDGLYTNATVALRPRSGELVWHFQHVANDQWDLDWTYERQIMELPVNGQLRKVVVTAGKMALFDALDAATGQYLFSLDLGLQNLIGAIDPVTGAKTMNPNAAPIAESAQLVCPFAAGGRNWQASSYNADSKVLFMPIAQMCMMGGALGGRSILSTGAALDPVPVPGRDGEFGRLQAVNMETRELLWDFREMAPPTTAIVATAGEVIFSGTLDHRFKALDAHDGSILWETNIGDIPASYPVTYMANGKQYIALTIGQPTIHAGTFMGAVTAMTGGAEGPMGKLQPGGAALVVYALP